LYKRLKCLSVFLTAAVVTTSAFGQAPAPAPAPAPAAATAPAPPPPPPWSVGPIDFSGLVDGYYTWNPNHPGSATNGLYNFDTKANQFSLSMAKLTMSHTADPIGFQVDLGFGKAFDIINGGEPGIGIKNIEQAYVTWKPKKDSGLSLDFGKFVTSAGAEVIESNANWNYSRSILFAWAIPYYHFGFRMTETKGHFTGGIQLVNGWNEVEDVNSGKTLGFVGNITSKKISWNNNYYTGPENAGTNKGWRNLYDTTVLFTPADKFNAYFNFDYGQNNNGLGGPSATAKWYGIAVAAKFQATDKVAFTPRIEWFKDRDGFSTGTAQNLKEFTLTYEYKWMQGLLTRVEYRHDWSDEDFFERGSVGLSKHQDTLALGIVAFFGPH
jgi:hypothetical protein